MRGRKTDLAREECAIARTLAAVGDWWSLLIVRDALNGSRRFGEFQRNLQLAKNILTTRLHKLVNEGIFIVQPASDGSAYKEYVLSEKGEHLYVVMIALWQWGEAYSFPPNELNLEMVDLPSGQRLPPVQVLSAEGRVLGPREVAPRYRVEG